ncbi:MAG: sulfatase-like hydrolase/transferase [bacterium]
MKPNIIVIMSDQHSKHLLGCYGNKIVRTPNLDKMAKQGMRFTGAYCPAPICVPSRMSFMTSRTPSSNAVYNNTHILHSGIPTWAHHLSAAEYETALIGRMHFVGPDQYHGFEKRFIGEIRTCSAKVPKIAQSQWRQGAEITGTGSDETQWYDALVRDAACRYIEEKGNKSPDSRPFAAVVGLMMPHSPFIGPKDLFDHYYDKMEVPEFDHKALPPTIQLHRKAHRFSDKPLSHEQILRARAAYYARCEVVDRTVGKILETLDKTGLTENTMIVYTSDHGEMIGQRGLWFKNSFYEGSAGIPLIVSMPGIVKHNVSSNTICNLMDLGPTFCELAGAPEIIKNNGTSLLRTLKGEEDKNRRDYTFCEMVNERMNPGLPMRMIRSGKWKLWYYGSAENLPPALFNMEADPDETNDLCQDPQYGEIRKQLLKKLLDDWNPDKITKLEKFSAEDSIMVHKTEKIWENKELITIPPEDAEQGLELFPYDF